MQEFSVNTLYCTGTREAYKGEKYLFIEFRRKSTLVVDSIRINRHQSNLQWKKFSFPFYNISGKLLLSSSASIGT